MSQLVAFDELDDDERELFKIIVADPPWLERGGGKVKRGADRHYELMKTPDIIDLLVNRCEPLRRVDEAHSALCCWVTNNFLRDGLAVMDALGYRYITNLAWAKDRSGLGYYFFGQHELVLFGVKGRWKRPPKVTGFNTTLLGGGLVPHPRDENNKIVHSRKPPTLHEVIEARFTRSYLETSASVPYLELFSRQPRPGWEVWGNEVDCKLEPDDQPSLDL